MKEGLKYIKFEGYIKELGKYEADEVACTFVPARLLDVDGNDLVVDALVACRVLPKLGMGTFEPQQRVTLYMLRYRNRAKFVAGVVAMRVSGKNYFYPAQAAQVAKAVACGVSRRATIVRTPLLNAVPLGIGFVAVAVGINASGPSILPLVLGCAAAAAWAYWFLRPLFASAKYAGLRELDVMMQQEGIEPLVSAAPQQY